jgi:antitoxin HicB
MSVYIALIHKEPESSFGISFPDLPGTITAGDTADEAIARAEALLNFMRETWDEREDGPFPKPRSIDELRQDAVFLDDAEDAILVAIPLPSLRLLPAAE